MNQMISEQTIVKMPTPIAHSVLRFVRCPKNERHEKYNCLHFLYQSTVKTIVSLLSSIHFEIDDDENYRFLYELFHSDGVGSWIPIMRQMAQRISEERSDIEYAVIIYEWLNNKPPQDVCDAFLKVFQRETQREYNVSNNYTVLNSLTTLRNATSGHGAQTVDFYQNVEEQVEILGEYIVDIPTLSGGQLLYEMLGTLLPQFRVLDGVGPSKVIEIEKVDRFGQVKYNTELYFKPFVDGKILMMPPVIQYNDSTGKVLFVNSAISNKTNRARYINYYDGMEREFDLIKYQQQPIRRERQATQVSRFTSSEEEQYIAIGQQFVRPKLLYHEAIQRVEWHDVPMRRASIPLVPTSGGVYALAVSPHTGGLKCNNYVGYIGRTEHLRDRLHRYLMEQYDEFGRENIRIFMNEFTNIRYYYTIIERFEDQVEFENWLIKAIDPFVNIKLRLPVPTVGEADRGAVIVELTEGEAAFTKGET